jgi:hypothetical protein
MQWNIGFAKGNIEEVFKRKKNNLTFKWFEIDNPGRSIADPFIFKTNDGNINVLYEIFSMVNPEKYGKIELSILDADFVPIFNKEILDTKKHVSYPFIFTENDKTYIIPESRQSGKLYCYEYDFENRVLINERIIIDNLPLLDSTIFKHNNRYWLFATLGDRKFDHSKLYIYFADTLFGPYQAHPNNPVKYGLNGTRPAGNIIKVGEEIYRPAQNCKQHYGESITINRITKLSENEFTEEPYFEMTAEKNCAFNSGLHTINVLDDIIVVDGIRMVFMPVTKFKLFLKKRFSN